jgi:antitoxin component YwqK of YwqJK toxin-antitoxin module
MLKHTHKEIRGKLCYIWERYWENSTLESRRYYHQGKLHGLEERYLPNGTPQYKTYHLRIK